MSACARLPIHSRRDILRLGLSVSIVFLPGAGSSGEANAAHLIRNMIDDMDRRFANAGQPGPGRLEAGRAGLEKWFDLGAIGAAALGDSWTVLAAVKRKRYRSALATFLARGLAERHQGSAKSAWSVLGVRSLPSGLTSVFTRIRNARGRDHDAEWIVDEARRRPIVDVTVDGITLSLRLRRDFAKIMNEAGFDALIRELERESPTGAGSVLP